jgi:hypothetical protein
MIILMNIILKIIIFLVVIIFYLNISKSLHIVNSLNIDELYYTNRSNLLEVLYFKTPIIIYNLNINIDKIELYINTMNLNLYSNDSYNSDNLNEINIIKTTDYSNLIKDKSNNYISFNNTSFINDDILVEFKNIECKFLPEINFGIQNYDIIIGDKYSNIIYNKTIYQYNLFYLINGSIELYLIHPKHILDLNFHNDYKNLNNSLVDISDQIIENLEYKKINIEKSQAFHIPYGWIYSIKYKDMTKILKFSYSNIFDIFANPKIYFINYINKNVL